MATKKKTKKTKKKNKPEQDTDKGEHKESKTYQKDTILYISLGILLLIFIVLFSFKYINPPAPVTIDDLHLQNAGGDLDEEEGYMYNGFSFVLVDGLWFTQIQKLGTNKVYDVKLHYSPQNLQDVFVSGDHKPFLELKEIYVTFDPLGKDLSHVALSAAELSINLAMVLEIKPIAACTKNETEACGIRPIVECTAEGEPTIYLEESDLVGVSIDGNCITVSGTGKELVRATDRLLLQMYGMME